MCHNGALQPVPGQVQETKSEIQGRRGFRQTDYACKRPRDQAKDIPWHCMHGFRGKETRRMGSSFTVDGKIIEPINTGPFLSAYGK